MVFVSILPYTIFHGKTYFLLGQERYLEWSDFGGTLEANETIYEGAAREAYEESMGFLGTYSELLGEIQGKPYFTFPNGFTFLIYRKYEPQTLQLFERFYGYVQELEAPEGYLEKISLGWFDSQEILNRSDIRKDFYQSFEKIWRESAQTFLNST